MNQKAALNTILNQTELNEADLKRAISRLMPILKQNKEVCRLAIEVSKKINEE